MLKKHKQLSLFVITKLLQLLVVSVHSLVRMNTAILCITKLLTAQSFIKAVKRQYILITQVTSNGKKSNKNRFYIRVFYLQDHLTNGQPSLTLLDHWVLFQTLINGSTSGFLFTTLCQRDLEFPGGITQWVTLILFLKNHILIDNQVLEPNLNIKSFMIIPNLRNILTIWYKQYK